MGASFTPQSRSSVNYLQGACKPQATSNKKEIRKIIFKSPVCVIAGVGPCRYLMRQIKDT